MWCGDRLSESVCDVREYAEQTFIRGAKWRSDKNSVEIGEKEMRREENQKEFTVKYVVRTAKFNT